MDLIGKVLGGRYEIIEEVGSGGMANVYKARCTLLNRYVAVKVLKKELVDDQEFIHRFRVEAQAAAAISHENIVGIYDVGNDDDIYYIVMELIKGPTLQDYIEKNGKLEWHLAVEFSKQICAALNCAHKNNIIHRDIKPHNIIVAEGNKIKVTDFGIARAVTAATITLNNNAMGSVHYFSPEQARGGYTDQRSDLYSLGVTMYQMLTGMVPFDGDTPVAIAIKHLQQEPVSPKEFNIAMPLSVEAIVLKAMAKETRNRYQTATEMLNDLNNLDNVPEFSEQEDDMTRTRLIDTNEVNKRLSENLEKVVEKPQLPEKEKPAKTGLFSGDKKTVILAVVTSLVLIGFIIWGAISIIMPNTNNNKAKQVDVPNIVGKVMKEVEAQLPEGVTINVTKYVESDKEKGLILTQDPVGGGRETVPFVVNVTVSKSKTEAMENYIGKDVDTVEKELVASGYSVEKIGQDDEQYPKDIIIKTAPVAGKKLENEQKITLYFSNGAVKKKVEMPALIGKDLHSAKVLISEYKLREGEILAVPSDKPKNTVLTQSVNAGSMINEYTTINITYSEGVAETVPSEAPVATPAPQKTKNIFITTPSGQGDVAVKIVQNGVAVYNNTHKSDESFKYAVKGDGVQKVEIYFNGTLNQTLSVTPQ